MCPSARCSARDKRPAKLMASSCASTDFTPQSHRNNVDVLNTASGLARKEAALTHERKFSAFSMSEMAGPSVLPALGPGAAVRE